MSATPRIIPRQVATSPRGAGGWRPARWALSDAQRCILENSYSSVTAFPDLGSRQLLATQLGVKTRQVEVWFQNRRQRSRKEGVADLTASDDYAETLSQAPAAPHPTVIKPVPRMSMPATIATPVPPSLAFRNLTDQLNSDQSLPSGHKIAMSDQSFPSGPKIAMAFSSPSTKPSSQQYGPMEAFGPVHAIPAALSKQLINQLLARHAFENACQIQKKPIARKGIVRSSHTRPPLDLPTNPHPPATSTIHMTAACRCCRRR